MLEICETCPNRMDCAVDTDIPVDGAAVLVGVNGLYWYVTNELVDYTWQISQGEIYDRDGTTFPELTEAFKKC